MQWFRSKGHGSKIPEVQSVEQCTGLLRDDLVVFFKHSPTCPVSWSAHREVDRFLSDHPDVPVHLISVRLHRDVAQYLAQVTGVQHESPQILVLRNGVLVGDASHDEVTSDLLARLTTATNQTQPNPSVTAL
jgi:bacillithiol system protein YtxJ